MIAESKNIAVLRQDLKVYIITAIGHHVRVRPDHHPLRGRVGPSLELHGNAERGQCVVVIEAWLVGCGRLKGLFESIGQLSATCGRFPCGLTISDSKARCRKSEISDPSRKDNQTSR
jgi:hypothetical protein